MLFFGKTSLQGRFISHAQNIHWKTCIIKAKRPCVFCLFEYSSDPEWNQTLNEAYIYERGWEDMFIVIKRYITYHFLVFVVHKQPSKHEKKKNESKIELYSSWVLCLCGPSI